MRRLQTMPFDPPMSEPDDPDVTGPSDEPSVQQDRIKLATAWCCATAAGIAALTYSTISQFSPTFTMAGLIGLLLVYGAYGYTRKTRNSLHFADSLYYMGFLWALFALISTFLFWPAPKLTSDAVLTTFGYALLTTFAGMLFRLLVIQFQHALPEQLVLAQETLDRRVAALTRQINEATMEIASFRERAAGELAGTLRGLVRSLEEARDNLTEQQRAVTSTMNAGFETSLNNLLGRLASIKIPQEILTTEIAQLVATLEKRGKEVDAGVQRLQNSLMQTAETVNVFGKSLYGSEAAQRIGAAVSGLSSTIKERTQEFADMTAVLKSSRTELDSQLSSLQLLRSAFSNVSARLSTLETELKDASSDSLSADVRNGMLSVQKAIQSSLDASKAVESAMRGVMFFLKEKVTEGQADGK